MTAKNRRYYSEESIASAFKQRQELIVIIARINRENPDVLPPDVDLTTFNFISEIEVEYIDRLKIEFPEYFI